MTTPAGSEIGPGRLFERLVDVLLPEGGYVMSLFEAYLDESADEDGKGLYAVSGYLFRAEQAKITDQKWKAVLDRYRFPYFHMVDCAHGTPPFDRLTKTERISAEKEMIALTTHAEFGVSAIVNPVRFSKINTQADPCIFCVDILVMSLCAWLSDKKPAKVAFFIESGNNSAAKSDASLLRLKRDPVVSRHYSSHAFASKEDVRLLQAADLLAWQSAKFMKDKISRRRQPRRDFLELLKHPHAFHYVVFHNNQIGMSIDESPHIPYGPRDEYLRAMFSYEVPSDRIIERTHAKMIFRQKALGNPVFPTPEENEN